MEREELLKQSNVKGGVYMRVCILLALLRGSTEHDVDIDIGECEGTLKWHVKLQRWRIVLRLGKGWTMTASGRTVHEAADKIRERLNAIWSGMCDDMVSAYMECLKEEQAERDRLDTPMALRRYYHLDTDLCCVSVSLVLDSSGDRVTGMRGILNYAFVNAELDSMARLRDVVRRLGVKPLEDKRKQARLAREIRAKAVALVGKAGLTEEFEKALR